MPDRNTQIRGGQIKDDTISEAKLLVNNAPVDGYILQWNASANKFEWVQVNDAVTETPSGTVNGINTSFTLSTTPNPGSLALYLNGLYQEEGVSKDYTISGTTITFNIAPDSGDVIIASYFSEVALGGGGGTGDIIKDADNDTKVEVEAFPDEDKIRFTTFNILRALIDVNGLILQSGADINEFSTDGTLIDNSDDAVPTEKAVKTYADTKIAKSPNLTSIDDTGIDDNEIAIFDLTNKKIKTSDKVHSIDGTLASNSDSKIPTEKAVKTYVDTTVSNRAKSYTQSFVNGNLAANKITINHGLAVSYPVVIVYDNNNKVILPTDITQVDSNNIELDFTNLVPLTGTYNVRIVG